MMDRTIGNTKHSDFRKFVPKDKENLKKIKRSRGRNPNLGNRQFNVYPESNDQTEITFEQINQKHLESFTETAEQEKKPACNCKNSKCIKLYCECLKKNKYCSSKCQV